MNQKRKQVITTDKVRALRCKSLQKNKEIETAINVALKQIYKATEAGLDRAIIYARDLNFSEAVTDETLREIQAHLENKGFTASRVYRSYGTDSILHNQLGYSTRLVVSWE